MRSWYWSVLAVVPVFCPTVRFLSVEAEHAYLSHSVMDGACLSVWMPLGAQSKTAWVCLSLLLHAEISLARSKSVRLHCSIIIIIDDDAEVTCFLGIF